MNLRHLGPEPSALAPALQPVVVIFYFSFRGFASEHPHRRVYGKKPVHNWTGFTGATGLEPAISGLTGQRDNQLRYAPVSFADGMLLYRYPLFVSIGYQDSACLLVECVEFLDEFRPGAPECRSSGRMWDEPQKGARVGQRVAPVCRNQRVAQG